jgi:hypothetical protein
MSWEDRLRDIVLAGGTLAAVACSFGDDVPCCNANSDPCCEVQYCGAPMNAACACEQEGGVYDPRGNACSSPDAASDGGGTGDSTRPVEAGDAPSDTTDAPSDTTDAPSDTTDAPSDTTDAPSDTTVDAPFVGPFCCNANPDPCCTFLHCGAPMNATCACKLDGGTFSFDSGSLVCVLPDANSPTDAGGDADGHD